MAKKVLITGGAGFIAHHLIEVLLEKTDWEIISIDRLDFSGNLNRLHEVVSVLPKSTQKRVTVVYHDLKAELNSQIVNRIGDVNIILHLAAGSHVDRSIEYPMEFVLDNVVGTTNLLNYARNLSNLERFVYFSTDEVFGPAPEGVDYKERDRYNATNPYSASKAAAEEMCVAFENTYNLPLYITHTMNVFGERQHPEKYIPMCIRKLRDNLPITVHSDPSKTKAGSRHYIHAKDVAEGILHILNLKGPFENDFGNAKCPKFNLVGAEEIDNLTLAKKIADVMKATHAKYEMVDFHSARPGHDLRYSLSGEYMKSLGWQPRITLSERIEQVVNWTLENDRWLK